MIRNFLQIYGSALLLSAYSTLGAAHTALPRLAHIISGVTEEEYPWTDIFSSFAKKLGLRYKPGSFILYEKDTALLL